MNSRANLCTWLPPLEIPRFIPVALSLTHTPAPSPVPQQPLATSPPVLAQPHGSSLSPSKC
ncbi:hypothetical protein T484DRAFT_1939505 [Baffinella frigidus]|nr:hypothetical protein T484DRAFT_1939505 [Cryptophyta sp. CCMP2293]